MILNNHDDEIKWYGEQLEKIKDFDIDGHNFIKIGANRETSRLIRVTLTFLKIVTLVGNDNKDNIKHLYDSILEMLDHKGDLYINWRSHEDYDYFRDYVRDAWDDANIMHYFNASSFNEEPDEVE